MPVSFCEVTSSTAPVATAASMALPPRRRISRPASLASGSLVATMPCRAITSERPCASQPCAREPGTASMSAAGCGRSIVGMPNGVGDCARPVAHQRARAGTAATAAARRAPGRRANGRGNRGMRAPILRHWGPALLDGDDDHFLGLAADVLRLMLLAAADERDVAALPRRRGLAAYFQRDRGRPERDQHLVVVVRRARRFLEVGVGGDLH